MTASSTLMMTSPALYNGGGRGGGGENHPSASASLDHPLPPPPKTLSEGLKAPDPLLALRAAAQASQQRAMALAHDLEHQWAVVVVGQQPPPQSNGTVDNTTTTTTNYNNNSSSSSSNSGLLGTTTAQQQQEAVTASIGCTESVYHTLTKIASGGTEASMEIRHLEHCKRNVDAHAHVVSQALQMRQCANQASMALQVQDYARAAEAVRPWLDFQEDQTKETSEDDVSEPVVSSEKEEALHSESHPTAREYAGESVWAQLDEAHTRLRNEVTTLYRNAVQHGDLAALGKYTPVLALIRMESEAVELYLQYLKAALDVSLSTTEVPPPTESSNSATAQRQPPTTTSTLAVHQKVARVYNGAVQCLRHHLPLVSHCLWQASGDVSVVCLVHSQVQYRTLPLLNQHRNERRWKIVAPAASAIATALADRATGRDAGGSGGGLTGYYRGDVSSSSSVVDDDADDCGFATRIGTLSDVNAALDEAALLLQHSESYLRFVLHCCHEINKARTLRGLPVRPNILSERGGSSSSSSSTTSTATVNNTPLHQALAELGGEYATVEHCLLLASMQRSFAMDPHTVDPRQYYRPLAILSSSSGPTSEEGGPPTLSVPPSSRPGSALQTSVLESCWYAARKSAQRAFATGHTGTASAVVNYVADALQVLLEVSSQRAEDSVSRLESLLVSGSAGSLLSGVMQMHRSHHPLGGGTGTSGTGTPLRGGDDPHHHHHESTSRDIAWACAFLNDLEVSASHSRQLEAILRDTATTGFPSDHATEQLVLCIKALGTITDGFTLASNGILESLEGILKPRIRSMLGEAAEGSSSAASALANASASSSTAAAATTFMGSTAMIKGAAVGVGAGVVGGSGGERVLSRMNYHLNDDTYNLLQLSESYMSRLATSLDNLLHPLRESLAPRLWDRLLLDVLGTVAKRVEASLRRCEFTPLGALALDADLRDLVGYAKDRFRSSDIGASNVAVAKACVPMSRLLQISRLLNADNVDDAVDLMTTARRRGLWDLSADETRAVLVSRIDFDPDRANELLLVRRSSTTSDDD